MGEEESIVTEREKIRTMISIQTYKWEEFPKCITIFGVPKCITIFGGPKYTFFPDGNLRSVTIGEKVYHG